MLRVNGFQAVNWNAPDPAATERFYTEVLGGRVAMRHQVRGVDVVRVELGNFRIGIFDASAGPSEGVPHHTLAMPWPAEEAAVVADIEATGVRVQGTRQHGDGPGFSVYVNDPIGNRLELSWDPPAG